MWGPFSGGLFARYDIGTRQAAKFQKVVDGRTLTIGEVGGDFSELWLGPIVRTQWRALFVEVGYGLIGIRHDDARDDLPDQDGQTDDALRTSPTVAWLLNVGGSVPITTTLHLAIRLEYRVRYYDRRGGPLAEDLVHGTQTFTPFIGVAWTL